MVVQNKREILVECDCGLEILRIIKYQDEYTEEYYIEVCEPHFYSKQDKTFWQKLKHKTKYIWYILLGKEYKLEQIVLNRKHIEQLIDALNKLKNYKEDEIVYLHLNDKEK